MMIKNRNFTCFLNLICYEANYHMKFMRMYIYIHTHIHIYIYVCVYVYIHSVSLYLYVPDEGSLLPKYRDCTTSNDLELYLMCCCVMLLLLIICIYTYIIYNT